MMLKVPDDKKEYKAYFVALYRLRNDEDFKVFMKHLQSEIERLKKESMQMMDETLLRWNQGAVQVLDFILSNIDDAVNRREIIDQRDQDSRHKELVKRTAPSGAGESFV